MQGVLAQTHQSSMMFLKNRTQVAFLAFFSPVRQENCLKRIFYKENNAGYLILGDVVDWKDLARLTVMVATPNAGKMPALPGVVL